jgi:hypothetical protein
MEVASTTPQNSRSGFKVSSSMLGYYALSPRQAGL